MIETLNPNAFHKINGMNGSSKEKLSLGSLFQPQIVFVEIQMYTKNNFRLHSGVAQV